MTSPRFLHRARLQDLIDRLGDLGYRCIGPHVRNAAIVYDELPGAGDRPGVGLLDDIAERTLVLLADAADRD